MCWRQFRDCRDAPLQLVEQRPQVTGRDHEARMEGRKELGEHRDNGVECEVFEPHRQLTNADALCWDINLPRFGGLLQCPRNKLCLDRCTVFGGNALEHLATRCRGDLADSSRLRIVAANG